jgi:hypothetical protein
MPVYQVYRLKDHLRQQFRWAPHVSGVAAVKPKDYEECFTIEAETAYDAWNRLKDTDRKLLVGDLLGIEERGLRILKYIGFEEARWVLPEPKSPVEDGAAAAAS